MPDLNLRNHTLKNKLKVSRFYLSNINIGFYLVCIITSNSIYFTVQGLKVSNYMVSTKFTRKQRVSELNCTSYVSRFSSCIVEIPHTAYKILKLLCPAGFDILYFTALMRPENSFLLFTI